MGAGDYDVAKADELGFSIKLLGISSQTDSGAVLQRVHPAMIPKTTALGSTHGVINGLFIQETFKAAACDDDIMMRQKAREEHVHRKKMMRLAWARPPPPPGFSLT